MSYRTKTCAYCNGNHAILDCTKLVEDAKNAQEKLNQIANNTDEWLKEAVIAFAKSAFYYELNCKSDPNGDGYIIEYDGSTKTKKELTERTVATLVWRCREHFASQEEARKAVDPDVFDTFPTTVTYEERWNNRDADREYRPSNYRAIIKRHNEVQEAVAKRSKKSCSYCRGEGPTVRTCSQKKTDVEIYHDAFKVASYLQARALSRFGLWTSSLVKQGDHYYTFNQGSVARTPFFLDQIPSDLSGKISTEDLTDCLYFMAFSERSSFKKMNSDDSYYSSSTRMGFEISRDYLKFFDLESNTVDFSVREEGDLNHGSSSIPERFLPAVIDTEHIFKQLMANYKEPMPKKDRYASQNEMGVGDCGNLWDAERSWRRNIWVQNRELFDRKQRNKHIFEKMAKFTEQHADILKKANDVLNKS